MLWLHIEDSYYFSHFDEVIEYLKEIKNHEITEAENWDKKVFVFTEKQLEATLIENTFDKIIVSPYTPSHFNYNTPFFGVLKIPNKYGLLTSSEKKIGLTEYEKLHNEVGLTVEKSPVTFDDMAGSDKLRDIARKLSIKYSMGEIPKAVFLAGVPGTGKSFFAQCLAGETDRFLVSFNLTKIMYSDNPIETFDKIIDFLVKENKKYLLWVDEIEKMFTDSEKSEHIKNKFLTFLNDLGITINLDGFVVMTANNVSGILEKNPELVRGGRVETFAKVFLDFPKAETATSICKLYVDKRNKEKDRIVRLASYFSSINKQRANTDLWIYEYAIKAYNEVAHNINDFSDIKAIEAVIKNNSESNYVSETLEKMQLPLEAEKIVDYIDRAYITVCDPKSPPENFPYVPAEIKELVTQLYYKHLEINLASDDDEFDIHEIYDSLMKDNIPIGEAGGLGIDKMKGNEDKFSIIIK
jgi:SpoVK/Ycf46/Vps4 family AAA+-type ATPase